MSPREIYLAALAKAERYYRVAASGTASPESQREFWAAFAELKELAFVVPSVSTRLQDESAPRYLITVTADSAQRLEKWLGGMLLITPAGPDGALAGQGWDPLADLRNEDGYVPDDNRAEADRRLARIEPVQVAGLDAVFDIELANVDARLRAAGPRYHAGGPS
jgi:hypothetical protein